MTFKYFAVNLGVVLNGGWKKGGESQMGNCKIRFCCTVRCLSEGHKLCCGWAFGLLWECAGAFLLLNPIRYQNHGNA